MENEAFFYATVASAAARRASKWRSSQLGEMQSSTEDQAYLLYTSRAMSVVRRELSNRGGIVVPDAVIGVIAFLAMLEAVDPGDGARSETHMSAAERLVRSRGHRTISWVWYERIISADLKTACISKRRPRLPFPRNRLVDQLIRECSTTGEGSLVSSIFLENIRDPITPECYEILVEIKELNDFRRFSSAEGNICGYDTE